MGDPDPKWYSKVDACFPAFPEEPTSLKACRAKRETRDYRLLSTGAGQFTYIPACNPPSFISSVVEMWPQSGGANTGTHILGFPKPTLSATPGTLTRGYRACPQEKGEGAKTEQEVVNDHSIHEGQSWTLCTELT